MVKHIKQPLSDELLNSYIDHQITREEQQEIKDLINQDKSVARRVYELQQIKSLTHQAYEDIPPSNLPDSIIPAPSQWPSLAAAIAIFSLGFLIGNSGILQQGGELEASQISQSNDALNESKLSVAPKNMDHAVTKVLVHLTSSDVQSGLNTLNNLEQLLLEYQKNAQPVKVEVVANGKGIKLLRPSMHQIAQRVASLSEQFDNVSFAACKNTIDQIELTEGQLVDLIPQVKLIESGVVEVIRRQQDGWTYIRG